MRKRIDTGKREILAIERPPGSLGPQDIIGGYKPLSDYAAIGNTYTGALVGRDGSIDWCCLPHFDSPSVFAALLDATRGGHFAIRPCVEYRSSQRYIYDTNILVTTFETHDGSAEVEVVDHMPLPKGVAEIERAEVHRLVCGVRGRMDLEIIFRPRPDYGREVPTLKLHPHGVVAQGISSPLSLSTVPLSFQIHDATAIARLSVGKDEVVPIVLAYSVAEPPGVTDYHPLDRLSEAQAYWRGWAESCRYSGGWRDLVMRAALLKKMCTLGGANGIIAGITAGLPFDREGAQGVDNRHIVAHDASQMMEAIFNSGGPVAEAEGYLRALVRAVQRGGNVARGGTASQATKQHDLSHLEGSKASGPVVIGLPVTDRFVLSPLGEVLRCAHVYWQRTGMLPRDVWPSLTTIADFIALHWTDRDYGRWEDVTKAEHYTYSKVVCSVGLEAAATLAEALRLEGDTRTWRREQQAIKNEVIAEAWDDKRQSFVMYYGSDVLDASGLLFALYGFIPADHPMMISTADQIVRSLSVNGLLRRFEGDKSASPLCSLWLAQYLIRKGQAHDAEQLFGRIIDLSNHVGLYAQAVEPSSREFLGNFPDTLVHAAFINCAYDLSEALRRER